jgi:hypothetical protein
MPEEERNLDEEVGLLEKEIDGTPVERGQLRHYEPTPRTPHVRWRMWVMVSLLVVAGIGGGLYLYTSTFHPRAETKNGLLPSQIGLYSNTQTSCQDLTTCGITSLSIAADSVVLVGISAYTDTTPSAVAVVGDASGTCSAASLIAGTASTTYPHTLIYGCKTLLAFSAGHLYVNFSAANYYDVFFVDFTNTVVTTTYSSGTGSSTAASTAGTCAATTTVAGEEIFEVAGFKTTAETSITADTSGFTAMTEEKTTTDVVSTNAMYGSDSTTGSFTSELLGSASADHETACVGIEPAKAPVAPTGLTAGTPTATTIPLSWTNPTGPITAAEVYWASYSGSCGTYSSSAAASSPYTSYTITGLVSGNSYCAEVTVSNSTGASPDSTPVTNVQTAHAPSAPTYLVVVPQPATTTELDLNWTLSPGTLVNQTLSQWTATGCTGTVTHTNIADPATSQTTVTGLTANKTYWYTISDWNSTGQSAPSSCVSGMTFAVPNAPTGIATTGATSYTVSLDWINPTEITIYNDTIDVGTTCGTWTSYVSTGGAASLYTVSGLNPLTAYCFAVQAWSGGAESAASPTLIVQTLAGPPGAPTNFVTTSVGGTSIAFSWTNPSAASGALTNATFYWGTSCGTVVTGLDGNPGTWANAINLDGTPSAYTVTGLYSGTSYCFSVAFWTEGGQGAQAIPITQETNNPVPSAPGNLTYDAASRTTVTINWTQPLYLGQNYVVNDTVVYWTGVGCTGTEVVVNAGVTINLDQGGLTVATTYYWEVAAWSNGGEGPYSSCIVGATQGAIPPAPFNLASIHVGTTFDYLTWETPSGYSLNDVIVYVSLIGGVCGVWSQTDDLGGVYTNYEVTGLTASSNYCIQALDVDNDSPLSTPLYVTTEATGTGGGGGGGGSGSPQCSPAFPCPESQVNNTTQPIWYSWPPLLGWPDWNPLNWLGALLVVVGTLVLVVFKRPIAGPLTIVVGVFLLFVLAV